MFTHLLVDRQLVISIFWLLWIAFLWKYCRIFFGTLVSSGFISIPRIGIARLHGNSMFYYLRKHQTVLIFGTLNFFVQIQISICYHDFCLKGLTFLIIMVCFNEFSLLLFVWKSPLCVLFLKGIFVMYRILSWQIILLFQWFKDVALMVSGFFFFW